jgi:tripartite-type tricarboxylate transporter receptor subunit TctC
MTTMTRGLFASIMVIAAVAAPHFATAQSDFYAGRRINLIIGFTSGGGVDTYGRLLARHIGRHIPGNPTVIAQNMPGAAGLTAIRALDVTQPKDGTAIVTFTPGLVVQALTTPEQLNVDFSAFSWLGSFGQDQRICFMWKATGVKTWDELLKREQVVMGDTGGGGQSIIAQRVLRKLFGVKIKSVLGYPGSSEKRLAIERGELDGDCGALATFPPDWLRDGKINPVLRFQEATDGISNDVVYAGDLVRDDPAKRQLLEILNAAADLGRPFLLSKDVPVEQVEILRAAFDRTMSDSRFIEDARKLKLDVTPTSGAALQQRVKTLYATPPGVLAAARDVMTD